MENKYNTDILTMAEYQVIAHKTAVYPVERSVEYLTLGLCSEAGEFANKIKKIIRGDPKFQDTNFVQEFATEELGGALWYVAELCTALGLSLSHVAQSNLDLLADRKSRVDAWMKENAAVIKGKELKMIFDRSDGWKYGILTDGMNTISKSRSKFYTGKEKHSAFKINKIINLDNTIPSDVMKKLRWMKNHKKEIK